MSTLQLLLTIWVQCHTFLADKASIFLGIVSQCLQTSCATGTYIVGQQNEEPYKKIHHRQTQKKQMLALKKYEGRAKN